jgi:hypothetical protein
MVRSKLRCVAIEAKWTEPSYDTVSEWIERGQREQDQSQQSQHSQQSQQQDNREEVMAGWLELLAPHAARDLDRNDFANCVYQMVHRAASACHGTKHPQLAYCVFHQPTNRPDDAYLIGLQSLHAVLGTPCDFPFYFGEIQINPTEAFRSIEDLPKGSLATAHLVRSAFQDSELFKFLNYRIHKIG